MNKRIIGGLRLAAAVVSAAALLFGLKFSIIMLSSKESSASKSSEYKFRYIHLSFFMLSNRNTAVVFN